MKQQFSNTYIERGRRVFLSIPLQLVLVLAVVACGLFVIHTATSRAASTSGTLALSPSSGTYTVGQTVTLTEYENSGSVAVNAVESDITYPSSMLQYQSYDVNSSGFNYPGPSPSVSNGEFQFAMISTTPLTGNQEVLTITFKVLASGSATIGFANTATVAEPSGTNEGAATSGATLTLQAASQSTPPPTTTPPPSNSGSTTSRSVPPTPAPTPTSSETGIDVTPSASTTPVNVANNGQVEVSAPVAVSPIQSSPVSLNSITDSRVKVEYFLNGKLVATILTSPFTYILPTNTLLNGTYTLETKTFYASGNITSTSQKVIVNNPTSVELKLVARDYGIPLVSILLVLCLLIYILFYGRSVIYDYITRRRYATAASAEPATVMGAEPRTPSEPVTIENTTIRPPVQAPGDIYTPQPPQPPFSDNEHKPDQN